MKITMTKEIITQPRGSRNYYNALHSEVNNLNPLQAMGIAASIKELLYIPYYEVVTFRQAAEYFGVPEQRVRNILIGSQSRWFKNNLLFLGCKDVEEIASRRAASKQNGGGMTFVFPNGAKAFIGFVKSRLINANGVLHLAIALRGDSKLAWEMTNFMHTWFVNETVNDEQSIELLFTACEEVPVRHSTAHNKNAVNSADKLAEALKEFILEALNSGVDKSRPIGV